MSSLYDWIDAHGRRDAGSPQVVFRPVFVSGVTSLCIRQNPSNRQNRIDFPGLEDRF